MIIALVPTCHCPCGREGLAYLLPPYEWLHRTADAQFGRGDFRHCGPRSSGGDVFLRATAARLRTRPPVGLRLGTDLLAFRSEARRSARRQADEIRRRQRFRVAGAGGGGLRRLVRVRRRRSQQSQSADGAAERAHHRPLFRDVLLPSELLAPGVRVRVSVLRRGCIFLHGLPPNLGADWPAPARWLRSVPWAFGNCWLEMGP